MKAIVIGKDPNALLAALELQRSGHEVTVLAGGPDPVSSLLPGSPLAPEVGAALGLGATLEIVGRVGVTPDGQTVTLKLKGIEGEVTERDASRWPEFVKVLNNASELWRALYAEGEGTDVVGRWREFGRRQAMEVMRLPCQSLRELLEDWFESDLLKATLAAAALRGTRQGPFAPGSAFLLLQRWARGEFFGRSRLESGQVEQAVRESGVEFLDDSISSFEMARGKVVGLETTQGSVRQADLFVTSADPARVLSQVGVGKVDPEIVAAAGHWDTRSTTAVVRLAPQDKWNGALVNFCRTLEDLERAYDPTKYGQWSEEPFAELDSKSGYLYLQHVDSEQAARDFCSRYELGEVLEWWGPAQIEERFEVTGGHLFGGEKVLWQSYALRESLRNPCANLYLCGASSGPGDHSGVSGLMLARQIASLAGV